MSSTNWAEIGNFILINGKLHYTYINLSSDVITGKISNQEFFDNKHIRLILDFDPYNINIMHEELILAIATCASKNVFSIDQNYLRGILNLSYTEIIDHILANPQHVTKIKYIAGQLQFKDHIITVNDDICTYCDKSYKISDFMKYYNKYILDFFTTIMDYFDTDNQEVKDEKLEELKTITDNLLVTNRSITNK